MSSNREQLLGDTSGRAAGHDKNVHNDYGSTSAAHATLGLQRTAFREQDSQLEQLSGDVKGVRDVAGLLNAEITKQNQMLDDVIDDVENANRKTEAAASRTARTERSPYSVNNFCMLLWPTVFLFTLLIFGLKHLLFW